MKGSLVTIYDKDGKRLRELKDGPSPYEWQPYAKEAIAQTPRGHQAILWIDGNVHSTYISGHD